MDTVKLKISMKKNGGEIRVGKKFKKGKIAICGEEQFLKYLFEREGRECCGRKESTKKTSKGSNIKNLLVFFSIWYRKESGFEILLQSRQLIKVFSIWFRKESGFEILLQSRYLIQVFSILFRKESGLEILLQSSHLLQLFSIWFRKQLGLVIFASITSSPVLKYFVKSVYKPITYITC